MVAVNCFWTVECGGVHSEDFGDSTQLDKMKVTRLSVLQ